MPTRNPLAGNPARPGSDSRRTGSRRCRVTPRGIHGEVGSCSWIRSCSWRSASARRCAAAAGEAVGEGARNRLGGGLFLQGLGFCGTVVGARDVSRTTAGSGPAAARHRRPGGDIKPIPVVDAHQEGPRVVVDIQCRVAEEVAGLWVGADRPGEGRSLRRGAACDHRPGGWGWAGSSRTTGPGVASCWRSCRFSRVS